MFDRLGGIWNKVDGWLLRRSWAPTFAGLLWFFFSVMLLVQGLLRGFNLVSFIATFLLAMWLLNLLVTLFSGKRLRQLWVKRRLLGTVHVGTPVFMNMEIENRGYSRVTGLRFMEQGEGAGHSFGLNQLKGQESIELRQQVIPTCRGPFQWQPLAVSTGNPFGLFRRTLMCPSDEPETLVLPMLGQVDQQQFQRWLRHSRRASSLQTRVRAKRTVAPADFYGIRSYRPGDSPRWIHWRSTARVGVPMVREFEEPPQDHITILLDAALPDTEEKLQQGWMNVRAQNLRSVKQYFKQYDPPTPEEVAYKLAELRHTEAPYAQPLHQIEQAISLACTLCYLWTRKLGSTITLGVLDGRADLETVLDSGPTLRQLIPVMERLALVQATPQHDMKRLQREWEKRSLPPGPVILITPGVNSQATSLTRSLNRPVQVLDMSKTHLVQRFFHSQAMAVLKAAPGGETM